MPPNERPVPARRWIKRGLLIALALAVAAWPELPVSARFTSLVLVPTVGLSRIYVGAHLPLDVVGGFALGFTVEAVLELVLTNRED